MIYYIFVIINLNHKPPPARIQKELPLKSTCEYVTIKLRKQKIIIIIITMTDIKEKKTFTNIILVIIIQLYIFTNE